MMSNWKLLKLAMKYHWDSQKSNPANLWAGTIGMVVNNLIILWGLWAMLFNGKPEGEKLTLYFLALNGMITIAWGSICFFFGGVQSLGQTIEEGSLEPMLSTPRDPLFLIGISQSVMPALGDLIQGMGNLLALCYLASWEMAIRTVVFTFVSGIGFLGLFIFMGSIPFFVNRGNALAQLLLECNLSLSFYPTGKIFSDRGRLLLFLTPAAVTGVLPMTAIDEASWSSGLVALIAALLFLVIAIKVFSLGLKRYQTSSYVVARA
jgi:ABC-2 type transport system permease protein